MAVYLSKDPSENWWKNNNQSLDYSSLSWLENRYKENDRRNDYDFILVNQDDAGHPTDIFSIQIDYISRWNQFYLNPHN